MFYIGLLSGTSVDAVDAALVQIENNRLEVIQYQQIPIENDVKQKILAIQKTSSMHEICTLDVIMGEIFAQAAINIMQISGIPNKDIQAIGSHGQTILHMPDTLYPNTLQIGNPNIIAYKTGIKTVANFRGMDMAAGGQGAPLVSAFHQWQFQNNQDKQVVLNLGGIANLTILPNTEDQEITGFDTGPSNILIDAWIRRHLKRNFDQEGQWAKSGECDQSLLKLLLADTYFKTDPPKSTGKDVFNLTWLDHKLAKIGKTLAPKNVQATLLELTVTTISNALKKYAPSYEKLIVCGGGVYNITIIDRLKQLNPTMQIHSTTDYGIEPNAVEAVAFAWLAKCRLENQTGNIPSVTGAKDHVLLGAIYDT